MAGERRCRTLLIDTGAGGRVLRYGSTGSRHLYLSLVRQNVTEQWQPVRFGSVWMDLDSNGPNSFGPVLQLVENKIMIEKLPADHSLEMMLRFAATNSDTAFRLSSILPTGWTGTTKMNSRTLMFQRIRLRSSFSGLRATSSLATPESEPAGSGSTSSKIELDEEKEEECTADELHYVDVPGTEWRIALWRYIPCPKVPPFSHP